MTHPGAIVGTASARHGKANRCKPREGRPSSEAEGFTAVCPLDDIPPLGARVIERPEHVGGNVAVFRCADDRVFALIDRCPHQGGPLSQGIVHGDRVACPLHGWNIELASGTAVAPDQGCVRRFPAHVDGGQVFVRLPVAPDSP